VWLRELIKRGGSNRKYDRCCRPIERIKNQTTKKREGENRERMRNSQEGIIKIYIPGRRENPGMKLGKKSTGEGRKSTGSAGRSQKEETI